MNGQQKAAKPLPAYGRDLVALQRAGKNVAILCISLDWRLGRALPRVVVPPDLSATDLDLSFVAGVVCYVAHIGEQERALDVAEAALLAGASLCMVHDKETGLTTYTAEVMAARGLKVAA